MALGLPFIDVFFNKLKAQICDDFVDRLNYLVTTMLLMFFTLMVSAKQYFGSPIQCWAPAHFANSWVQYAEDFCFVENTYHVRPDQPIPKLTQRREQAEIGYYQWVPLVLALQATMFYIPNVIWKVLLRQGSVHLKTILTSATGAARKNTKERRKDVVELARYVDEALKMNYIYPWAKTDCNPFIDYIKKFRRGGFGCYISFWYLMVKLLYIGNLWVQFVIMNRFLGTSYDIWGLEIFTDLMKGRRWDLSGHFPRVTLCDFDVRRLGNTEQWTVQCVLMINMYNEKIYLTLWFWFLVLGVLTVLNLLWWAWTMVLPMNRHQVVTYHLNVAHALESMDPDDAPQEEEEEEAPEEATAVKSETDKKETTDKPKVEKKRLLPAEAFDPKIIRKFCKCYLKPDGVLILKLLKHHAGDFVTSNLTKELFLIWHHRKDHLAIQEGFQDELRRASKRSKISTEDYPRRLHAPSLTNGYQHRMAPPVPPKPEFSYTAMP